MCSRSSDRNCLLIYLQKIIYAPTLAVSSIFSFLIYTPGGVIFSSTSRKCPADLDPKVKYPKLCSTLMSPHLNCPAPFCHSQVSYCIQGMLVNHERWVFFLYWYKNTIRLIWQSTPNTDASGKAVPVWENTLSTSKTSSTSRSVGLSLELGLHQKRLAQGRVGVSSSLPRSGKEGG